MIKLAMIAIDAELRQRGLKSRMLLQVHDELVFDVPKEELETIKPIILDCMSRALALPNQIKAEAEIGSGTNWLEAH